jgi:micrococcal nuclease
VLCLPTLSPSNRGNVALMRPFIVTLALLAALVPAKAEPPDADTLYHYRAVIADVYDGDTVTVDVDLGFSVWVRGERLRLARIDAPEVRGDEREAGLAARDFLRNLILNKPIIVQTIRDRKGKFGRYIAELWLDGENVNDRLVAEGHAIYRKY